jgi:hypothetical protein
LVVIHEPYGDGMMHRQAFMRRAGTGSSFAIETILGPLLDPALIACNGDGMLLKGVAEENGGECVQEWWLRIRM